MQEQIAELKAKLQARQAEFQAYKTECKQLQEFLESQSEKKDTEIRRLKQQAIKKEKHFSTIKTQASQHQSEMAALKQQLFQAKSRLQAMPAPSTNNEAFQNEIANLKGQLAKKDSEINKKTEQLDKLRQQYQQLQANKKQLEQKIATLETQKLTLNIKNSEPIVLKSQKKAINEVNKQLQAKFQQSQAKSLHLSGTVAKLEAQILQLKQRCSKLKSEKGQLAQKLKEFESVQSPRKLVTTSYVQQSPKYEEEEQIIDKGMSNSHLQGSLSKYSLIITKKHYLSPFMEIKNQNELKLYKSNKNGFQKSLGAKKFKMDLITYQIEPAVEKIVNSLKGLYSEDVANSTPESIFILGSKRSSKKYLMAAIVSALRERIVELSQKRQLGVEVSFVKRSQQQEKNLTMNGKNEQQIANILQEVEKLGTKNTSVKNLKKVQSKPKIRHFSVRIGQYVFEIITSSHTQVPIKDGSSLADALNQTIYNRATDLLQVAHSNKQLVLTLNPIVQNYQDCKNCLSLCNCKQGARHSHQQQYDMQGQSSPMKDEMYLNDSVKKKIDSMIKDNQQHGLKVRRLEEECQYYRTKFDDLEFRLKNLLNTHNRQNSYLKKSPTTLSYEKLLKFVHSVLARNTNISFAAQKPEKSQVNELPSKIGINTMHHHFDTDDEPI